MVQRLLTKYGLAFHIACVCLFAFLFLGQSRVFGLVPLFWLSLVVIEWMILIPSVRRGETLADARQRAVRAFWRDPILYIGFAIISFVGIQSLNSGCELVYLSDADVWELSPPPLAWAPFSIAREAAVTQLAVFMACLSIGVVLRVAVGKVAKRILLLMISSVSGFFALICVGLAFQGYEPWNALAAGPEASGAGTCFGFWLLVSMGLLAETLANRRRGSILFFVVGFWGNLLGMVYFASPLTFVIGVILAILLFLYWIIYLYPITSKNVQFLLFLGTMATVAAIVIGLMLIPESPAAKKMMPVEQATEYWEELSIQKEVRSKAAMSIWQDHLWTGVGPDGFYHTAGLAVEPKDWKAIEKDRAHVYNDGIQFLCEYGVFGAGFLLAGLIVLLIPICGRLYFVWQDSSRDMSCDRSFLLRLSPIVVAGSLAVLFCLFEGFMASPFRSVAVLLSWVCVLVSIPAFLPEKTSEITRECDV